MSNFSFTYPTIPNEATFKRDTNITFAVRSQDAILTKLDWVLAQYDGKDRNDPKRKVILCDLFITANYWIKSFNAANTRMKKERYPAVLALFEICARDLAHIFGCKLTEVGPRIIEIFGRELTEAGEITDRNHSPKFYDEQELKLYRFRFKSGRVYQYQQNPRKGPMRLVPVNSSDYYEPVQVKINGKLVLRGENWSPFVMTVEREFYMSKHTLNTPGSPNIFHSAYKLAGKVSAAGTMLIKNGQILGIRGDSGHYQPRENNIAMAITALGMHSVPLMPIQIVSFDDNDLGSALDFVRSKLSWFKFEQAAQDYRNEKRKARQRMPLPQPPAQGAQGAQGAVLQNADHEDLYQN